MEAGIRWNEDRPASGTAAMKVLVVDDLDSARAVLASALDQAGHQVLEAGDAEWALEQFIHHRPDVVLLDVEMPTHDGYWIARRMRELEPGGWTPIIYVSGRGAELDLWRGIEAGGDDYLVKPVEYVVLQAKLRAMQRLSEMRRRLLAMAEELRAANERLTGLAESDALTGLPNRRGLDAAFAREFAAARRTGEPLSFLLCDVDHFKLYNDQLGHLAGDRCLVQVGEVLRELCRRPSDYAARYGGEEFAVLLPQTPRSGAALLAKTLRGLLLRRAIPHPAPPTSAQVTLSIGIATCVPDASTSAEMLVMRADEALYVAKKRGRNGQFSFDQLSDENA